MTEELYEAVDAYMEAHGIERVVVKTPASYAELQKADGYEPGPPEIISVGSSLLLAAYLCGSAYKALFFGSEASFWLSFFLVWWLLVVLMWGTAGRIWKTEHRYYLGVHTGLKGVSRRKLHKALRRAAARQTAENKFLDTLRTEAGLETNKPSTGHLSPVEPVRMKRDE